MADTSKYKVGIVLSVENKTSSGKKPLKVCVINVGGAESITVVTSATNVREGSRCACRDVLCRRLFDDAPMSHRLTSSICCMPGVAAVQNSGGPRGIYST